jgi:Fur family transcriptional regulator, peroxide stress response regulator
MKDPRRLPRKQGPYRKSRQRERMLELLRSTEAHPTANWLYGKLRKEFPDLSLGTVYRNIGILIQQGLISRIAFGSTFDHLDANMKPHYHFICEKCHSIMDLELPPDPRLNAWPDRSLGFKVSRHEIEFYGLCPKCARKA